jgi:hypothetical protein
MMGAEEQPCIIKAGIVHYALAVIDVVDVVDVVDVDVDDVVEDV